MADTMLPRRGIDILADILHHCEQKTNTHILTSLQRTHPHVVMELKKRLITFDDLANADTRGVQRLLKMVTLRDLALSLKGAPEEVLKNLAHNMSTRAIEDLREEITYLGPMPASEIDAARGRILTAARSLRERNELYFKKNREEWVD